MSLFLVQGWEGGRLESTGMMLNELQYIGPGFQISSCVSIKTGFSPLKLDCWNKESLEEKQVWIFFVLKYKQSSPQFKIHKHNNKIIKNISQYW